MNTSFCKKQTLYTALFILLISLGCILLSIQIVNAATEVASGTCGDKIICKDHSWNSDYTVDKAATCTEDGSESIHCSVCGLIQENSSRTIKALGHDFQTIPNSYKEPTCTEAGKEAYQRCKRCEIKYTKDDLWLRYDGEAVYVGITDYAQSKLGDIVFVNPPEVGDEVVEGKVIGDVESATSVADLYSPVTGVVLEINYGPLDDASLINRDPYGSWIIKVGSITKTRDLLSTDEYDVYRGQGEESKRARFEKRVEGKTIPAKGHKWNTEYTVDKKATCAKEGSESIHCSVCDAIKENSSRTIQKKPHSYGEWNITKEPSCTDKGLKVKVCADCGDKVTEEISAKGHQWNTEYTVDKSATNTEEGSESIHCSVCGQIQDGSQRSIPIFSGSTFKVTSSKARTVTFTKAKNVKSVMVPATVTINGLKYKVTTVNPNAFKGKKIRTVTIGSSVTKLSQKAFNGSKAATVVLKTKKLTKKSVRGSLKGSKVTTIKVKVGKAKDNKNYVNKYAKFFTKANAGRKVSVK